MSNYILAGSKDDIYGNLDRLGMDRRFSILVFLHISQSKSYLHCVLLKSYKKSVTSFYRATLVGSLMGLYAMLIIVLGLVLSLSFFLSEADRQSAVYLSVCKIENKININYTQL